MTPHTLRHELTHTTQPRQTGTGTFLRIELIEGVTDALALSGGSTHGDLGYPAQAAAVLALGEELSRPPVDWLRELNSTATPENSIAAATHVPTQTACDIILDALQAAQEHVDFNDRVGAARAAVRARLDPQIGSAGQAQPTGIWS